MIKLTIISLAFIAISFSSFSQKESENVLKYIQACETCSEVVMISAGLEKKYTGVWFENVRIEDGYLVFTKGTLVHRWNMEKFVFIEENSKYFRIYLEQAR